MGVIKDSVLIIAFILYFSMLWRLEALLILRIPSPGVSFLEGGNTVLASEPFICKSTHPESLLPTAFFIKTWCVGPLYSCSNQSRDRYQTTRGTPTSQSPLKCCRLTQLKPDYCAWSIPYHRNHNDRSCHIFPSHHLPPNQRNGFSLVVLLQVPLVLDLWV